MQALVMSNTSTVTLEVVLTVQRLVRKFGAEQDSLTWDLILDIAAALIASTQVLSTATRTRLFVRDVSEFESEFKCCRNLTILGKSEIRWICRLVYVGFGLTVRCTKLIYHSLPSIACYAEVSKCTLNSCFLISV